MTTPLPFLTVTSHNDPEHRRIILLHSDGLRSDDALSEAVNAAVSAVPPSEPLTLVYLHGGVATSETSGLWAVRSLRSAYETFVPEHIRSRLQQIVAVHVSVVTRGHIYMSSFGLQFSEYSKLVYCDLLADLERLLGVDSTLLGLRSIDFQYDEQMRYWVGRQDEFTIEQPEVLDPSKPLINTEDIYFSTADQPIRQQRQPSLPEP